MTGSQKSDILLYINNTTSESLEVYLLITHDDATTLDETVPLAPSSDRSIDSKIETEGEYELEVTVQNGLQGTYPFSIGKYELDQGSRLIVNISTDDVEIFIQE